MNTEKTANGRPALLTQCVDIGDGKRVCISLSLEEVLFCGGCPECPPDKREHNPACAWANTERVTIKLPPSTMSQGGCPEKEQPKPNQESCPPPVQQQETCPPPEEKKPSCPPPPEEKKPSCPPPPEQKKPSCPPPPEQKKPSCPPPPEQKKPACPPPPEQKKPSCPPPPEQKKPSCPPPAQKEEPKECPKKP